MLEKLTDKIGRLKASTATLRKSDQDCIVRSVKETETGRFECITFGFDNACALNDIHSLIANIASLKDHLKVWCKQNGITFDAEKVINRSRDAAIIHDLWNIEKHGKLDNPPRSGFMPRIGPISLELANPDGTSDSILRIFTNSYGGADFTNSKGEKLVARIRANVLNGKNSELGDILEICESAISQWTEAYQAAGVPVSPSA
jgi:hypothetical protein